MMITQETEKTYLGERSPQILLDIGSYLVQNFFSYRRDPLSKGRRRGKSRSTGTKLSGKRTVA
jgi:hypothetical protein